MTPVEEFLIELDRVWGRSESARPRLQLIGSMALMLQAQYQRGTKDGDVLETHDLAPEVRSKLLHMAGRQTELAVKGHPAHCKGPAISSSAPSVNSLVQPFGGKITPFAEI